MTINNQLLRFYTLLYLRIQCFVSRVMFIVNLVIYLLLMNLSYTVFSVLFTKNCYSVLHCVIPMIRCLISYGGNNREATSIDGNLRFSQLPLSNILFVEKVFIFKDAQYRGTKGIFNNRLFVRAFKYNNFSLVSHSQDLCFLDCVFHCSDIRFAFFFYFF